jgi:hypothetical protein
MILEIKIDEGFATMLAAIIAALLSLFTLLAVKPAEMRSANRQALEPYIHDISDSIHQILATSTILLKNKSETSRLNWTNKASNAKEKLKEIRPKTRYSLWGLEKYLLSLTRLPDYTLYTLEDLNVANKVVKRGGQFGNKIDKCVRQCYIKGRAPRFYDLWILAYYNWRFKKVRNDYKSKRLN